MLAQTSMSQLTVQQSYFLCWEFLPDRNRKSMGLWYWELMSRPDPAVLPVGTLHSLEWFWVSRRIFICSFTIHLCFSLRRLSVDRFRELFLTKILAQLISYLTFTLMGRVSWAIFIFVLLASFLILWWPNNWPKMGFPDLFEKTIGPIHFIPCIEPHWKNLLTLIHFRVPSLIFGPLVVKNLAKNGVSGTFWKKSNYWLKSFHTLILWHVHFPLVMMQTSQKCMVSTSPV